MIGKSIISLILSASMVVTPVAGAGIGNASPKRLGGGYSR